MNYYIATKLENHKEHNRLRDKLNKLNHTCTYDWTTHGPVYEKGLECIERTAKLEHEGVANADVVIILWPGGRGTHVELGMAIALDKRVLIVSAIEDHHQATKETCAFYHHPCCFMYHDQVEIVNLFK